MIKDHVTAEIKPNKYSIIAFYIIYYLSNLFVRRVIYTTSVTSFVKYDNIPFMKQGDVYVCWTFFERLVEVSLCEHLLAYFPLYLFLNHVHKHSNRRMTFFHYLSTPWSPSVCLSNRIHIVNMPIIQMICYGSTWNKSFLKFSGLSCYSKDNTVVNGVNNIKRNFI